MNKTLLSFLLLATVGASAQTIVSTSPANKKVILEDFTGINCVYCPQGHQIASSLKSSYPNDVFVINVHQGGFATPNAGQPDFRTSFGNAIANQTGLTGYPSATVNRHVFPAFSDGANATAMSRSFWSQAAQQIMQQSSYVNVATQASIDVNTRVLTVLVEAYYTGNSPQISNKINVALLQNNTKGPQTGGNQGNNYTHQHRLVHLITGQWGETINSTSQGSFYTNTFTYTIPEHYNNIPAFIEDMEIVAFVTEGSTQEIISGHGTLPSFTGLEHANNLAVKSISTIAPTCVSYANPKVKVQNFGTNPMQGFTLNYSINGSTPQTYNYTNTLNSMQSVELNLSVNGFAIQDQNTLTVQVTTPDDNAADNILTATFNKAPNTTNNLTLTLTTDGYAYETSWNIQNISGVPVASGSGSTYGNNSTVTIPITLQDGCHLFNLVDSFGDGAGAVTLKDSNNQIIFQSTGNYGSGVSVFFEVGTLGVSQDELAQVRIFPNPTNGTIYLSGITQEVNVDVFDLAGKKVHSVTGVVADQALELNKLTKGVYLAKITTQSGVVATHKIVIN